MTPELDSEHAKLELLRFYVPAQASDGTPSQLLEKGIYTEETVGDLDILVTATRNAPVMQRLVDYDAVDEVVSSGKTRATVILRAGLSLLDRPARVHRRNRDSASQTDNRTVRPADRSCIESASCR